MGQARTVDQIYRLLTKESVEELMRYVLAMKSDLFDENVVQPRHESDSAATNATWDGAVVPASGTSCEASR